MLAMGVKSGFENGLRVDRVGLSAILRAGSRRYNTGGDFAGTCCFCFRVSCRQYSTMGIRVWELRWSLVWMLVSLLEVHTRTARLDLESQILDVEFLWALELM